MKNTKRFILLLLLLVFQIAISQSVEISGKVESIINVENIHIINKTAKIFTTTNKKGEFKIVVKLNDTLMFSSIQHVNKQVIINKNMILNQTLTIKLQEQINELDEVLIGKVLTGNLLSDIKNAKTDAPINFFDIGIPGYKGKPATQTERRFNEATTGPNGQKLKWYSPLMGQIPINPILNAISGRTKMLKNRVEIEKKETLIQSIKTRLSKDFFASNPLKDDLKTDFFYFCADDKNFINFCKHQTDFKILIFLRMKYRQYLQNLNPKKQ